MSLQSEGAYTLHHEFTPTKIEIDKSGVERVVEFINKRENVFSPHENVKNIVTGEKIDVTFQLNCIEVGEEEFKKFKKTCLKDKSMKLFATIKNVKILNSRDQGRQAKTPHLKKESLNLMKQVDIARLRGFSEARNLE